MTSPIADRIANVPGSALLTEDEVAAEIQPARAAIAAPGGDFNVVTSCNASDFQIEDIRSWLTALPVSRTELAVVIWPAFRAGAVMETGAFFDRFDDLWYPGADDVWIRARTGDWLLEMTHEEEFTLRRKRLKPVR